jgi:hypothetical protein
MTPNEVRKAQVAGFTVQGPKKKKTKKQRSIASFMNPKKSYYKFVQPSGFNAMKKKKQLQA